jgi:transcriptional regulator
MRRSKIALRLRALTKNVSALRTEDYFRERASRANIDKAKRILKRAGRGKPPIAGDEI